MTDPSAGRVPASQDLLGRRAVVTGANSGLGFETSLELVRRGMHVVLAVRDIERGEAARRRIVATVPAAVTALEPLDLSSLDSVRAFAERQKSAPPPDLLVNNAGIMAVPYARTTEGFEMQFGVNHLGHFALTGLLLPAMLRRPGARIVTLSSLAHIEGRIDLANLDGAYGYRAWAAYQQSKLANLIFALELNRRLRQAGSPVLSLAAHPGLASTELFTRTGAARGWTWAGWLYPVLAPVFAQSPAAGARPVLHAATAPGLVGGEYFGPKWLAETRGPPKHAALSPLARDEAVATRLWQESERRTGVTYDFLR